MRSAGGSASRPQRTPATDKTTRARIRDAAIRRFATSGFGASVRAIAQDAAVSPGLVMHHFGSKDALRAACDEHVLAQIRAVKNETIGHAAGGGGFLQAFAGAQEHAALLGYVLRSMQDGSSLAREFIDRMVDDAVAYTRHAVAQGIVVPSRDEVARARHLTFSGLGALLLEVTLNPPEDPSDLRAIVDTFLEQSYLPMLELYTEGFLTTRRMLDDYLMYVTDPPEGATAAG
ncbi:TetR/AcrR family transcriptional regulator [Myceligenerans indicum]|uniref:TetR/AcrR family transcriptional regulator n=1 Tax=Myceligenerans indicum TaxID=2593663 RepID=A0ABS1LMH4_9MICO|nr:TetR/AcrR family transcriptional regulator [Myceligenerans indicum]MBL0887229.1 TetR/AcrR family transcriptional regulator [Myceligenerans indicum]